MSSVLRVAASGAIAQQLNMETIANNLANMSTSGYKKVRTEFQDLPPAPLRYVAGDTYPIDSTLNDVLVGIGVTVSGMQRLFTPGTLQETGRPLDLAIDGPGFLQVQLPDGNMAYTKDGALNIDANGMIVNQEGFPVIPNITVPGGIQDVQIDHTGAILGVDANGDEQNLGQIQLAKFPNPAGLVAIGHNLFQTSAASGVVATGDPGTEFGVLRPGMLEASNVDVAEEMTRMIEAQRAYEMSLKAVQTLDEMLGMANALRK